jgi:membrane protease YdiL (CAAX protease family)
VKRSQAIGILEPVKRKISFSQGMFYELGLLVFGVAWGVLFRRPVLTDFRVTFSAVIIGVIATVLPLIFFFWASKSTLPVFVRHQSLMDSLLPLIFGEWSVLQLTLISLCAGVAEETLFRDAIQGGLAERIGPTFAIISASALFGASHLITWTYGIIAALIGVYLGLLYVLTGNLLAPMITHALYDVVVLVWLLKIRRQK